jgi:hypothetical protein
LTFGQLLYVIVFQWYNFTGGDNGIHGIRIPAFLTNSFNFYLFTLFIFSVCYLVLYKLTQSPFVLTLRAIRENAEWASEKLAREFQVTLLFTEHDMAVVFGISQKIRVLHLGAIIATGTPREISQNPDVQRIYLGDEKSGSRFREENTYYDLSHILFGVSLSVAEGECVCLLGRNSAGKTTFNRLGESRRGPQAGQRRPFPLDHGAYLRHLPSPGRTAQTDGRYPERRRAANVDHCAITHGQPGSTAAGRAL